MRRNVKRAVRRIVRVPLEWLGIILGLLASRLLPYRGLLMLSDIVSVVAYHIDRRGRVRSLDNLRILHGKRNYDEYAAEFDPDLAAYDPTRREELIIRRAYRNMARTIGHVFWTMCFAKRRVAAAGEMAPDCAAFLAANRSVVAVSAHVGCWEILSQLALLNGHRMMSIAKRIGTRGMTALLMRARESIGQEIVPADGALKMMLDGVRSGKSLGFIVDQAVSPKDGGVWVRFLGRAIPVTAAPAFFAAKAKVSIIVVWSRPLRNGRYRCETVDEIGVAEARDIWVTTQRCAAGIERVIRRHPSCWALNYNYFSNRPSEADLAQLAKREGTPFVPRPPREVFVDLADGGARHLGIVFQEECKRRGRDLSPVVVVVKGNASAKLRAAYERVPECCINMSVRFADATEDAT